MSHDGPVVSPGVVLFVNSDHVDGDYRAALAGFLNETRAGIKTPGSRWIDSICYLTMAGESYYQLGQLPAAQQQEVGQTLLAVFQQQGVDPGRVHGVEGIRRIDIQLRFSRPRTDRSDGRDALQDTDRGGADGDHAAAALPALPDGVGGGGGQTQGPCSRRCGPQDWSRTSDGCVLAIYRIANGSRRGESLSPKRSSRTGDR